MENCTECKLALDKAWQIIMSEGIRATEYRSLDTIALDIAIHNGWLCDNAMTEGGE